MPSFEGWCRWLLAMSIMFLCVGLVTAFAGDSFLFAPYNEQIASLFFGGGIPAEARSLRSFFYGLLGGTIAGSYLLRAFVIAVPFRRRERWAWHASFWSTVLWFVVDSSVSIAHGAHFNVWMINLAPLLLLGVPMLLVRKEFGAREVR